MGLSASGRDDVKQIAGVLLENDPKFVKRFNKDSKAVYRLLVKSLKKIVEGKALDTFVDRKNGTVVNVPVSSAVVVAAARVLKELLIDKQMADKKAPVKGKGNAVGDIKGALEEIEKRKKRDMYGTPLRVISEGNS